MSTTPRLCARCGEPLKPKKTGRPPKVHPECRAAWRAERARARRKEQDPETGSAEREARRLEGFEKRMGLLERIRTRAALTQHGLMGSSWDRRDDPLAYTGLGGAAWGENGDIVPVHHDPLPEIIPPGAWRKLVYRAALSISAATADVAAAFIEVWRAEDRPTARRHLDESIDEPEAAVAQIRALDIEARLRDALALVGPCAVAIFDLTGEVAILEALTGIPGYGPGGEFRHGTLR